MRRARNTSVGGAAADAAAEAARGMPSQVQRADGRTDGALTWTRTPCGRWYAAGAADRTAAAAAKVKVKLKVKVNSAKVSARGPSDANGARVREFARRVRTNSLRARAPLGGVAAAANAAAAAHLGSLT